MKGKRERRRGERFSVLLFLERRREKGDGSHNGNRGKKKKIKILNLSDVHEELSPNPERRREGVSRSLYSSSGKKEEEEEKGTKGSFEEG